MRNFGLPFFFFLLVLATAIALACGSGAAPINTTGILNSITISPATADAQNYPAGQVPFIATGYYSTPPSPVTSLTATWGACSQDNPTSGVSVGTKGLAPVSYTHLDVYKRQVSGLPTIRPRTAEFRRRSALVTATSQIISGRGGRRSRCQSANCPGGC